MNASVQHRDDRKRVVLLVFGNPFRGDDGVGPLVARLLAQRLAPCTVVTGLEDSLAILNAWDGADLAVIVDAAALGAPVGTIHRLEPGLTPLPKALARCSSHGLGLAEAVRLAQVLQRLPGRLLVYGIEAGTFEQGAALSSEVASAAATVVQELTAEIAAFART